MADKESRREYHRDYMRKRRAGKRASKDNGNDHLIEELVWKQIPYFEHYMASECGHILSKARKSVRSNGRAHTVPAKVLKSWPDTNGYLQVAFRSDERRIYRSVHRLVYMAWKGEIPGDKVVDHIDANNLNNRADNLQLLSNSRNVLKGWEDAKRAAFDKGFKAGLKAGLAWEPGESVYTWS